MKILYCNCTYAKVVPADVKQAVLRQLSDSGQAFDAVADLCDMSARRDPALQKIADGGCTKIAACYPRSVKWLFHAAGVALPKKDVTVLNMREDSAATVVKELLK